MSESEHAPVIRIVKKKVSHGGHHGGSWKVAYADFVTAMMAFFLVMWIIGLDKPTRLAIAAYFKDPVGFMKATQGGKSPITTEPASNGKPSILPTAGAQGGQAALQAQFKTVAEAILKRDAAGAHAAMVRLVKQAEQDLYARLNGGGEPEAGEQTSSVAQILRQMTGRRGSEGLSRVS